MVRRLPTGIDVLDRKLSGGIPAGSVVALVAPPASQSELFLYELTSARRTLYLSTHRTEQAVRDGFERAALFTGDPLIQHVPGDAPLEHANRLIQGISGEANLIIDPVDVLEREDENRYRNFLNGLQNHMHNTGSIALLHCLDGRSVPDHRDATEHMADVVFELHTTIKGDSIENRLAVTKFRGGTALPETIKLELAERVSIDTSRDIA